MLTKSQADELLGLLVSLMDAHEEEASSAWMEECGSQGPRCEDWASELKGRIAELTFKEHKHGV